jgi:hypothetical protein
LILPEILSVINSRESGFSRILGARDISGAIENAERTWIWNPDWETTERISELGSYVNPIKLTKFNINTFVYQLPNPTPLTPPISKK